MLWPVFVREHGCVFLGWHSGSNPPPPNDTLTGWESFVNHTHIFDEYSNDATRIVNSETLGEHISEDGELEASLFIEEAYDERHPDFIAACELGRRLAKLWALKLKLDFPHERFRVYYTQYDNPIVRFHKVREGEGPWLSDEALQITTDPSFKDALIYDTSTLQSGIPGQSGLIQ